MISPDEPDRQKTFRKTETSKQQSFAYSADNLTWDLHREVCEAHLQAMPSSDEHPHPYTPHETNGAHMEHYQLGDS